MGLYDQHGEPKWAPSDWAWQGDTMLCLDTEKDRRAFPGGALPLAPRLFLGRATQV